MPKKSEGHLPLSLSLPLIVHAMYRRLSSSLSCHACFPQALKLGASDDVLARFAHLKVLLLVEEHAEADDGAVDE